MTIEIHPTATISPHADIEDSIRGTRIVIGEYSTVDSFVKIKPAGGSGDLIIGNRVQINSGCIIYTGNGVVIGNNASIAAGCIFASTNHGYSDRNKKIFEHKFLPSKGGIIIEEDVWVGAGCVLLDGAILRKGCVIGAMSLVRGEVPAHSVQAGNPLKLIGQRQ